MNQMCLNRYVTVDYQTRELYIITIILNTGRDVLIIRDYMYFRFVEHYRSHCLELHEIYCRMERAFVYKVIGD